VTQSTLPSSDTTARSLPERAIRALLELDRPFPDLTEAQLAAQADRDFRWNLAVNVGDGATFLFGAAFLTSSTILPLFLSKPTDAPLAFGLLAVIAQSGWFLPQLFTANFMERISRKKPVVVNAGLFIERLPVLLMPLIALWAAKAPGAAAAALLLVYAWHAFGAGIVAISWQDLIARCFPVERRGLYAGTSAFLGAFSGLLGSVLATWLLNRYVFPVNFAFVFGLAALGITASWVFLALTREPVARATAPRRSNRQYFRSLPGLLREDQNYRHFLLARMLMALAGMGSGFLTVSAVKRFSVPDSTVGLYTLAMLAGQTAANLGFGLLADRRGHKLSLEIGVLAAVMAFGIAWLATSPAWYFAVFALLGVMTGSIIVSGIMIAMEFCGPDRRPTYVGIANTGVGVVAAIAPLIGAALASAGYDLLFATATVVALLSLALFRFTVREPRWEARPSITTLPPATGE
jgi:MFS family permease